MTEIKSETLYRKYRPQSFEDILGQDEVVNTLKNSIDSGNISHSYLFNGTRGTGKTSIARIFAKEIGTTDEDTYEIDAASNRGIDEIREIRDSVSLLPYSSDFKVYIIDEVHMLTTQAFNALLKTLEEPPAHVVFILATTEKHKVPDTILSRCQVYDFKKANLDTLKSLLSDTAKKEGKDLGDRALETIAKMGNGSFRDSLSSLQKVISLKDKKIGLDQISSIFSSSDSELENNFLEALNSSDKESLYKTYSELIDAGSKHKKFTKSLSEKIRIVLLIRNSKEFSDKYQNELTEDNFKLYSELENINSIHLKKLLSLQSDLFNSSNPEALFELFLEDLISE